MPGQESRSSSPQLDILVMATRSNQAGARRCQGRDEAVVRCNSHAPVLGHVPQLQRLVTANDKQGWVRRMESARTELSPAAAKLVHEALVVQRPHLHRVFTDRHHVLAGGIPAHGIDALSVALKSPHASLPLHIQDRDYIV
uniref:Uncharacterized protein n=1 Tax=Zea mays TaxID=4577 RepID=C0HE00_MAIZE|nr:unknown [Zea mays]